MFVISIHPPTPTPHAHTHTTHARSGDATIRHDHPLFPGGVQVVKVAGAGHFVHQEKPAEVNRLMLEWFGRHG